MGQKKQKRFEALASFPNVLQYLENVKGRWSEIFGNDHPIIVELAAGKAEYTTERAAKEKDKNFIAIDVKGNRLYIGAKKSLEAGTENARYLRIDIDKIEDYFASGEIDEVWIIFPDPFLKEKRAKNRLTHPKFLSKYQNILEPETVIHLKTDSRELYDFTLETIQEYGCKLQENVYDIYSDGEAEYPLCIKTYYEKMHLADQRTISHVSFCLPEEKLYYVKTQKVQNERE